MARISPRGHPLVTAISLTRLVGRERGGGWIASNGSNGCLEKTLTGSTQLFLVEFGQRVITEANERTNVLEVKSWERESSL